MNSKEVRTGVGLCVGDVKAMVEFYRDVLGLNANWDGGDFADFETASGNLALFMYSREQFAKAFNWEYEPPKGINQSFEIGLWLPTYADVDAEYERLSKLGVSLPSGAPITYPFGIRNFYVADPEGNLIEIGSDRAE